MVRQNKQILIFENSYNITNYLIKLWTETAKESISQRGRFAVALSGGRTPIEFYCKLSNFNDIDLWQKTHIFQVDERFVPHHHEASNFRLIKQNLLDFIDLPPMNLHPIETDKENVNIAAEHYKHELLYHFGNELACFDLITLGLGNDGHTASLFPDEQGIDDPGRVTIPVTLNQLKEERISLSMTVINHAARIVFLVIGKEKAQIAKSVLEEKMECPASMVNPENGEVIFLLDKEAADQLSIKDDYAHVGEAIEVSDQYQ